MKHLIFVYGTLKQGHHNNRTYLGSAKFLSSTKTKDAAFEMFPERGVFPIVGFGSYHISGEVFEIDGKTLKHLDNLEAEGQYYHRREIQVLGFKEKVWMYLVTDRSLLLEHPPLNFLVKTKDNTQEWLNIEETGIDFGTP